MVGLWFIPFILIVFIVIPTFLMVLWNLTFPDLFGWPEIGWWQALRLLLIGGFLFGGITLHFGVPL
jgi:hypothetical protein